MNSTRQQKNIQENHYGKPRRFRRSPSGQIQKSLTKYSKEQPRLFFVKNVKISQRVSIPDLQNNTNNLQRLIKKKVTGQSFTYHNTTKDLFQSSMSSIGFESRQLGKFAQTFPSIMEGNFQELKLENQSIKNCNLALLEQNEDLKLKIKNLIQQNEDLKQKLSQHTQSINAKPSNQQFSFITNFLLPASENGKPFLEELNQKSTICSASQMCTTFSTQFFESQLYQLKQQVSLLLIELNCQKRKRILQVEQVRKSKNEELQKYKLQYSKVMKEYRQKMKKGISLSFMIQKDLSGKANVSRQALTDKQEEQLQYSFQEEYQQKQEAFNAKKTSYFQLNSSSSIIDYSNFAKKSPSESKYIT